MKTNYSPRDFTVDELLQLRKKYEVDYIKEEFGIDNFHLSRIYRHRNNQTIAQAAHLLGLSTAVYERKVERNEDLHDLDKIKFIMDFELYAFLRQQCGMTQDSAAEKLGCTRQWINRMENGLENCEPMKNLFHLSL